MTPSLAYPDGVMHIGEALAFLDGCRSWSCTRYAASCSWELRRPTTKAQAPAWAPAQASSVRRLKGEASEAMLCRLAALAALRQASGWRNPAFAGAGTACAGCQAPNRLNAVRLERRTKLPLCRACREGLDATAMSKR